MIRPRGICVVCRDRPAQRLCRLCKRSYDLTLDGDIMDVIIWSAARALRFERARRRAGETRKRKGSL